MIKHFKDMNRDFFGLVLWLHSFQLTPGGVSTQGTAVFMGAWVHLSVCLSPLTQLVNNSGSGRDTFLKYFGYIPWMFLHYFQIFSNLLYVCQSVPWLTSFLKIVKYMDFSSSG